MLFTTITSGTLLSWVVFEKDSSLIVCLIDNQFVIVRDMKTHKM